MTPYVIPLWRITALPVVYRVKLVIGSISANPALCHPSTNALWCYLLVLCIYFYVNTNFHLAESACLCMCVLFVLYILHCDILYTAHWESSHLVSLDSCTSTLLLCVFFFFLSIITLNSLQIELNWMPLQMFCHFI